MKLLLDTNTISYYLRGEPAVVRRWHSTSPLEMATSALVAYELRYGLARLPSGAAAARTGCIQRLLQVLPVLVFDDACAEQAAVLRAELEARGCPIGPTDTLIAATALRNGLALVTRNVREFSRVPGLQLVNWFDAA